MAVQRNSVVADNTSLENLIGIVHSSDQRLACVIIDCKHYCKSDFEALRALKDVCQRAGTLLIFDEIVSGFRCPSGSLAAQAQVVPDLSCYGKALANGYPLAVLAGPRSIMRRVLDIGLTGTFYPDAVALAAASASLPLLTDQLAIRVSQLGTEIIRSAAELLEGSGLNDILACCGPAPVTELFYRDGTRLVDTRAYFEIARCMADAGVFWQGYHILCRDHERFHLDALFQGYRRAFELLADLRDRSGVAALTDTDYAMRK